ncbi:MAG TPA: 16S rRNA (uracil(1498)-N(3))-methyltransferase [Acidobacteriota bacterium]|nr:16S rRNA (uracil(1498)-N(3))-methyltransferase [Acidobacteriota bacterium]
MYRALIEQVDLKTGTASLGSDEAHHLNRVRRQKAGDPFLGLDGQGGLYLCTLRRRGRDWGAEIVERLESETESPLHIVLAQALVKKDKFEWVIQKATELGVRRIVPLITERTEVRPRPASAQRKMRRWHKILVDALKQSGRLSLPQLEEPQDLAQFCAGDQSQARLVLDEEGNLAWSQALEAFPSPPASCTVYIGPEGGWDDRDRQVFASHDLPRIRLGPRTLRTETAPVCALTLLQHAWGDL